MNHKLSDLMVKCRQLQMHYLRCQKIERNARIKEKIFFFILDILKCPPIFYNLKSFSTNILIVLTFNCQYFLLFVNHLTFIVCKLNREPLSPNGSLFLYSCVLIS